MKGWVPSACTQVPACVGEGVSAGTQFGCNLMQASAHTTVTQVQNFIPQTNKMQVITKTLEI
jgi:hypothetical protein